MTLVATLPVLRPYQQRAVADVRAAFQVGRRRVLLVLPTGAGKTICFSYIASATQANGRSVLIVAHRRELIRQASEKLAAAGVAHGIIAPGHPETADPVQVGSVQTLARRLNELRRFDLVVLDEAHHAVAGQWRDLIEAQPDAFLLGVTATPERLDGRGLGIGDGGPFQEMVVGASVAELIAGGYLVPARVFAPPNKTDLSGVRSVGGDFDIGQLGQIMDRPEIVGDAVAHYRRHAAGLPSIAFCTSIAHAEHVAVAFRDDGWRATCAHGGLVSSDRDAAIGGLATGAVQVLTTCDLVSEGLDVPAVGAVSLLRPTQSLGLCLQQVGRGMRPADGKQHLIVLDHAGNIQRHGLPDTAHDWSLGGRKRRESAQEAEPTWRCAMCFAVQRPTRICRACGFEETPPEVDTASDAAGVQQVDGNLEEISAARIAELRTIQIQDFLLQPNLTRAAVEEMRLARGYKAGWTWHVMRGRRSGIAA